MSVLQRHAYACWKWGRRYPNVFPNALKQSTELYRQDRIERGIEEEPNMTTLYKAGYLLRVESCENDGDIEKTCEMHFIDKQDALAAKQFAELFIDEAGNICADDTGRNRDAEEYTAAVGDFVNKHTQLFDQWEGPQDVDNIDASLHLAFALGLTGVDEYRYTRAAQKVQLFEIPADVVVKEI